MNFSCINLFIVLDPSSLAQFGCVPLWFEFFYISFKDRFAIIYLSLSRLNKTACYKHVQHKNMSFQKISTPRKYHIHYFSVLTCHFTCKCGKKWYVSSMIKRTNHGKIENQVYQTTKWENKLIPNIYVVNFYNLYCLWLFFLSIGHIGGVTFQILKQ